MSKAYISLAAKDRSYHWEVPHSPYCGALKYARDGTWESPWWMPGTFERRARDFTRRGMNKGSGERMARVECNSTDCGGRLLVKESALLNGCALPITEQGDWDDLGPDHRAHQVTK